MATKKRLDFDTIAKFATTLDGVEVSTSYGQPSFKVRGTYMASVRKPRKGDDEATELSEATSILVVRSDLTLRDALLASRPRAFFITDHYRGWEGMCANLDLINMGEVKDLLRQAHAFVTRKKTPKTKKRARRDLGR